MTVYVYYGMRTAVRRVYGGDLVLLRRHVDAVDRPAICSGLYPGGEEDFLPRAAVVLTEVDAMEFETRWFSHADSVPAKFDRYLAHRGDRDAAGAPFRYVDCDHVDPTRSPWAQFARPGESLSAHPRAVQRYQRLPGRERALAPLAGPGVRRAVLVVVAVMVVVFLAATIARRPAAIGGVVPAALWMAYLRRKDRVRPESPGVLGRAALAGIVATAPIVVVEGALSMVAPSQLTEVGALITAFGVAALVEESGKALCLWSFRWNPEFDERFDGIVYAGWIGLGFASVENVLYLANAPTSGAYLGTFVIRALLAVPDHAIWAGLVGYSVACRRFGDPGARPWRALALAITMHGLYDSGPLVSVSLAHSGDASTPVQEVLGLLGPILVTAAGVQLIRRRARAALAADAAEAARLAPAH
ncbi:MAG TPA: PrsW family intramembrane metalloprotease [Sporichthyaceae bacterium]|jgi:RsiW-degrading membrane proteinase PrsW (M82 family)|nr:PrsW family intramembrane metalloprotease [Sporichthyaceae bacterium]